jgi:hypothetical protein
VRSDVQELDKDGQLPLEGVRRQGGVDTVVDPETGECSDLNEDIEETNESTSNRGGSKFGKVDGDNQRQETDGETTLLRCLVRSVQALTVLYATHQESSNHKDFDGSVGEGLGKGRSDEDDVGEDDRPLSTELFRQGQLQTGTEEGTALEERDQVGLGGGGSLGHLEVPLERVEREGSAEETGIVAVCARMFSLMEE